MSKYFGNLDKNKSCQEDDILVGLVKESKDLFCHFSDRNFNNSLFIPKFNADLKRADVIPVYKKEKGNIGNFRPISILPTLSKIYERYMYDKIYSYFNPICSKYQCGICLGDSSPPRFYSRPSSFQC